MDFDLLLDLHKDGTRQGPGSQLHTMQAIDLAGLKDRGSSLKIADIGCGTGASTLVLAKTLGARVTAIDLFPTFLERLDLAAKNAGLADKIQTLACSMDDLPFEEASLDAIWCEGAIYNMGFEKGSSYFKRFLKPKGVLAATEITWLTQNRPDAISSFWNQEYPEIATPSEKIRVLEAQDFTLKGYFPLSERCWMDNYYNPLKSRFDAFLETHPTREAKALVAATADEMALYQKYRRFYGYGFFIAEKT